MDLEQVRDIELSCMSGLPAVIDQELRTCAYLERGSSDHGVVGGMGQEIELRWDLREIRLDQIMRLAAELASYAERRARREDHERRAMQTKISRTLRDT